jgi:protease IV
MSRFLKIMAVLAAVMAIVLVLFLTTVVSLIAQVGGVADAIKEKRPHITLLKIEGPIMGAEAIMKSINRIAENDACKGVLLRVDSPGGAVGASQEILTGLQRLKDKQLPIVVSQGNVAASGGYYVSLAGDRIFANAGTLTGSIGVIMQYPEAVKLLDKVGLEMVTVKSGALKDVGNFSRRHSPEEIKYLQSVIDNVYGQFVDDILAHRKVEKAALLKVADGRILTGAQAMRHGLVDTLGGYQEARNYLVGLAKLEGEPVVVEEPPARSWIENALESRFGQATGLLSQAAGLLPLTREGIYFLWR